MTRRRSKFCEKMRIRIITETALFTATFEDNAASKAFAAMLPLSLDMDELNSNEKFTDL